MHGRIACVIEIAYICTCCMYCVALHGLCAWFTHSCFLEKQLKCVLIPACGWCLSSSFSLHFRTHLRILMHVSIHVNYKKAGYNYVYNHAIYQLRHWHACMPIYIHIHVPFSRVGLSPFCSGEASACKAVTSANLTLNCSSCSSANTVMWKRGSSSQSLPYNTYIAQIPARDVQPDASGCYTCVCDGNSYSFAVDIQAAGRYIKHTGKISS